MAENQNPENSENSKSPEEKAKKNLQYRSQFPAFMHSFDTIVGIQRDMLKASLIYQQTDDPQSYITFVIILRQFYQFLQVIVSPTNDPIIKKGLQTCYQTITRIKQNKKIGRPTLITTQEHALALKCESILQTTYVRGNLAFGIELQQKQRDKWNMLTDF